MQYIGKCMWSCYGLSKDGTANLEKWLAKNFQISTANKHCCPQISPPVIKITVFVCNRFILVKICSNEIKVLLSQKESFKEASAEWKAIEQEVRFENFDVVTTLPKAATNENEYRCEWIKRLIDESSAQPAKPPVAGVVE